MGANRYAMAMDPTEKVVWLYEATNPSDGHNPSDWTRLTPLAEFFTIGIVAGGHALDADDRDDIIGIDTILNATDEITILARSDNTGTTAAVVLLAIDPATGTYGTMRHLSLKSGAGLVDDANNQRVRIVEKTTITDAYKTLFDNTGSLPLQSAIANIVSLAQIQLDPNQLFDLISADGRQHGFYGVTEDAEIDGVRQRTVRANNTLETDPSSDITSEDHARLSEQVHRQESTHGRHQSKSVEYS